MSVSVQHQDFDIAAEMDRLTRSDPDIGAVVSFTGLVRQSTPGGSITSMELEHYPGMTERALQEIVARAEERWPLQGVRVIHRVGTLQPGEQIVLLLTASRHRQAAFEAAEFLMDYLKTRAPFWKQVESRTGQTWVEAKTTDDEAAERWRKPAGREAAE
jgi:molybdopterin synthase catalytic subunit